MVMEHKHATLFSEMRLIISYWWDVMRAVNLERCLGVVTRKRTHDVVSSVSAKRHRCETVVVTVEMKERHFSFTVPRSASRHVIFRKML